MLLNFVTIDKYSLFYVLQVHEIIIISSFDFFKDWKFRKYLAKSHGYKNLDATSKSVRPYGAENNLCYYTEAKSGDKWGQFSMLFDKAIVILRQR